MEVDEVNVPSARQVHRFCHDTLPWLISVSLDVSGLFDVMTFRHWIRIIGIALVGFGLLCLPSIERSPQSYGSGFAILSDTGFLLWIAIILIVSGAIAFVVSFVGSGRPR
jgi:hypothetical protein